MTILIIIIVIIALVIYVQRQQNNPVPVPPPEPPDPEPEPEPDKPKWSDYYPINYFKPLVDLNKGKWIHSDYESPLWTNYVNLINNWNETLEKQSIVKGEISDRKLWVILSQDHPKGGKLYEWTSDLDVYDDIDYWASPEKMHEYKKDKDGNRDDVFGKYRDDCDGFARFHNQYLFETCNYWLCLFLEIYWKKRYWNNVSNSYQWKNLGHAITVYKEDPESDWKCFSNQTWLSASHGEKRINDFVFKFVPINLEQFKDKYELTRIRARHPIEGTLLWDVKGEDLNV
jgi:hypothetical protein